MPAYIVVDDFNITNSKTGYNHSSKAYCILGNQYLILSISFILLIGAIVGASFALYLC